MVILAVCGLLGAAALLALALALCWPRPIEMGSVSRGWLGNPRRRGL